MQNRAVAASLKGGLSVWLQHTVSSSPSHHFSEGSLELQAAICLKATLFPRKFVSVTKWRSGDKGEWKSLSRVRLFATWWTIQSMEFTGVGRLSLLQGIFPTQGLNPGLPHYRQILYQLNHQGSLGMERLRYLGSTGATLRCSSWAWLGFLAHIVVWLFPVPRPAPHFLHRFIPNKQFKPHTPSQHLLLWQNDEYE